MSCVNGATATQARRKLAVVLDQLTTVRVRHSGLVWVPTGEGWSCGKAPWVVPCPTAQGLRLGPVEGELSVGKEAHQGIFVPLLESFKTTHAPAQPAAGATP